MPIEPIRRFLLWSSLVISTLLFVFVGPFRAQLEMWLTKQVPDYVALVAVSLVALLFLFAAGLIPKRIVQHLRLLRQFIMRNQFIEGNMARRRL